VAFKRLKVRSIEEETHGNSTNETGNGDSHDPREEQEANSLPVNSPEGTIAKTNANSGTGDTHGSRDGKLILGEDEDGDGSTHLHGGTTRWRVIGDLVAHD
jgi:hypothetical protein